MTQVEPGLHKCIEAARRALAIAAQIANGFNVEQGALHLGEILSLDRLSTVEGTQASLETLVSLETLISKHKSIFQAFVPAVSREVSNALSELSPDQQQRFSQEFMTSLQAGLHSQHVLYTNRERWIEAARNICELVQVKRSTIGFTAGGLEFLDEQDRLAFEEHLQVIEQVHQFEVSEMNARVTRIAKSAAILGALGTHPGNPLP